MPRRPIIPVPGPNKRSRLIQTREGRLPRRDVVLGGPSTSAICSQNTTLLGDAFLYIYTRPLAHMYTRTFRVRKPGSSMIKAIRRKTITEYPVNCKRVGVKV